LASKGLNLGRKDVDEWKGDGNTMNAVHFFNIIPLSGKTYDAQEAENEYSKFYVDESIVSFHSPDVEKCNNKNL
jgi:hypothetical protein